MKLFHTSPNEITKITEDGTFGSFLCFSCDIYTPGSNLDPYVYCLEIGEFDLIECCRLFYSDDWKKLDPIVESVKKVLGVDEDVAVTLLSEEIFLHNLELSENLDFAETAWWIQKQTAECSKILGYKGCIMTDEQGALYMIDGKQIKLDLYYNPRPKGWNVRKK